MADDTQDQPLKITVGRTPPLESGGLGGTGWEVVNHEPALPGPGPELPAVDDWSVQSTQPMQSTQPAETMGDASYIARKPNPWQVVSQQQHAPPVDNFQPGGGDFRGDVPQPPIPTAQAGMGDWAVKAVEPLKNYWPDYTQLRREAQGTMAKGAGQLTSGEKLSGVGNLALGGVEYATSPIQAGLRSIAGRPIENVTGIPKEWTEFAAGLAIPYYGLTRLPEAKTAARVVRQIVSPEAVSPTAERAAGVLRQTGGEAVRDTARTEHAFGGYNAPLGQRAKAAGGKLMQGDVKGAVNAFFDNYVRMMNQLPDAARLHMLDYMEGRSNLPTQVRNARGQMQAAQHIPPELQPVADEFRDAMRARAAKVKATKSLQDADLIDDYVTHYWKDPRAARAFVKQWMGSGKQGSGGTLKKRSIPTIADGIRAGLQPVSTNPIDIAMRYIGNMDKYIAANRAFDIGKAAGDVKFFKPGSRNVPLGWVELQGRLANKVTPAGIMRAHAPEDWALVYNNFISRGVHAAPEYGKAYDTYMRASNSATAFLLGLSGYHAFTMATEAFLSALARGVGELYTGVRHMQPKMLKEGAETLASAPGKFATSAVTGREVQKAYLGIGQHDPQFRRIVKLYEQAGGRAVGAKHAQDYQFSRQGSYWNAWSRGALKFELLADLKDFRGRPFINLARLPIQHIGRIFSTIAGPLFEHYIPLMKNGAFYDTMYSWLKANPLATHEEQLVAARKIVDTIDNRLGETIQQNIFWKQGFKQFAQAMLLSYSWNLGTIREIGGGAKDLLTRGPKALDLTSKEFSPRAAYVLAFPVGIATIHSFYQYLKTGQLPWQTPTPGRDVLAPRTGGTAPPIGGVYEQPITKKGVPYKNAPPSRGPVDERAALPGYQKDVFGWFAHPQQEAANKVAPLAKIVWNTVQNADWAGNPIIDTREPAPEWLKSYLKFVLGAVTPITVGQVSKANKPGSAITDPEKMTGIRQAPSWLQDPVNYEGAKEYRMQKAMERKEKFESPTKYKEKELKAEETRMKNKKKLEALELPEIKVLGKYGGPQ